MAGKNEPNTARISEARPKLALRFISGKYQGGEFPLDDDREIVVGRSSGLEMVLVEEMVSRRHAKITVRGGQLSIEDLGSTNGTFVNGEKVERATLREGDRVLIGTSILKVIPAATLTTESQAQRSLESLAASQAMSRTRAGDAAPRMSGTVDEIPLPDLLQLLGTSKKTGVLVIRTESQIGRIHLKGGTVHYALLDSHPTLPPLKSIYRMLGWASGVFQLDPADDTVFPDPLDQTVQAVLMEGFRQQDELAQLRSRLPAGNQRLVLPVPLEVRFRELSPDQLDVLQSVLTAANVDAVFDASPLTDLETGQAIVDLVKRGYLVEG